MEISPKVRRILLKIVRGLDLLSYKLIRGLKDYNEAYHDNKDIL